MNAASIFLPFAALVAGSLAAQQQDALAPYGRPDSQPAPAAPEFAVTMTDATVEHSLTGSDQLFLGAVIVSLSPTVTPYVRGLPPTLTDFVLLGACFGKGGTTWTFASPRAFVPEGVEIFAQGLVLDSRGLWVSRVHGYQLDAKQAQPIDARTEAPSLPIDARTEFPAQPIDASTKAQAPLNDAKAKNASTHDANR